VHTRESDTATVTLDSSGTQAAISHGPTNNGYLSTWDLRTGRPLVTNLPSYNSGASGLSYSPDGTRLADVTSSGNINIYNPDTGHIYDTLSLLRLPTKELPTAPRMQPCTPEMQIGMCGD
jgi:WD40 repeat protein